MPCDTIEEYSNETLTTAGLTRGMLGNYDERNPLSEYFISYCPKNGYMNYAGWYATNFWVRDKSTPSNHPWYDPYFMVKFVSRKFNWDHVLDSRNYTDSSEAYTTQYSYIPVFNTTVPNTFLMTLTNEINTVSDYEFDWSNFNNRKVSKNVTFPTIRSSIKIGPAALGLKKFPVFYL